MKEKTKKDPSRIEVLGAWEGRKAGRGTVGWSLESSLREPALIPTELPEVADL